MSQTVTALTVVRWALVALKTQGRTLSLKPPMKEVPQCNDSGSRTRRSVKAAKWTFSGQSGSHSQTDPPQIARRSEQLQLRGRYKRSQPGLANR